MDALQKNVLLSLVLYRASLSCVALSRYCDGTILVVRAEYAWLAIIASVQVSIRVVGDEVVGVVLNVYSKLAVPVAD